MNAAEALKAARAAGVRVELDGDDLLLEAPLPPSPALLRALSQCKPRIVALLRRTARDEWSGDDWKALYEERAAITEFDGGDGRAEAKLRAFECCLSEWLNRHPEATTANYCAWCGTPNESGHVAVPFGTDDRSLTWLHPECWRAWYHQRRFKAEEALAVLGIRRPSSASQMSLAHCMNISKGRDQSRGARKRAHGPGNDARPSSVTIDPTIEFTKKSREIAFQEYQGITMG